MVLCNKGDLFRYYSINPQYTFSCRNLYRSWAYCDCQYITWLFGSMDWIALTFNCCKLFEMKSVMIWANILSFSNSWKLIYKILNLEKINAFLVDHGIKPQTDGKGFQHSTWYVTFQYIFFVFLLLIVQSVVSFLALNYHSDIYYLVRSDMKQSLKHYAEVFSNSRLTWDNLQQVVGEVSFLLNITRKFQFECFCFIFVPNKSFSSPAAV